MNFAKSLTARFLQNTSGRLLLLIQDLTEIIKSIKVIFLIKMTFFPSLLVKPQTISSTLKCLKNDFLSNKLTVTKKFFPRSLINPFLIQNPWQKLTFDAARKLVTYYHYYAKMRMIWLTTSFDIFTSICCTALEMKLCVEDCFSKYGQIRGFLWIWSHLLKKSLMGNFFFCAVNAGWQCRYTVPDLNCFDLLFY